jgi:hypothetical protein
VRVPTKLSLLLLPMLLLCVASAQNSSQGKSKLFSCDDPSGILCTEQNEFGGYNGAYTGHDEPSILFYSNVSGSGNSGVYYMRLPKDPPTLPKQDGSGGTFNFQLHPAFWVGMAMCDDQSNPNPGKTCNPDTDANIFDGSDPTQPDYIGNHPGTAFMEMQFYPPASFVGSGDPTRWNSALNIDSLSSSVTQSNNAACGGAIEYVNFAFITKDGVPPGPPSPLLQNGNTFTPNADTLFYNPGDLLRITLSDTAHGLKIAIDDITSGESGFMVASASNGFAQIKFDPTGTDCNPATHNLPYDFHPMYATSSEHTRVPWAAHSYNIAFSDEIGHFEYCSSVASEGGQCTSSGTTDPPGPDENSCFSGAFEASLGLLPIGACFDTDVEFDGVPYQLTWPGTLSNPEKDRRLHAQPVVFTSPLFMKAGTSKLRNYKRVAFENDLPRVEFATTPPCQRHVLNPADPNPGQGCVDPAPGTPFYPIFTTAQRDWAGCVWQLGGAHIPGTTNTFGGTSTAEYDGLLELAYPAANGQPSLQ